MPHLIDWEIEVYRHQAVEGILHNVCVSLYKILMFVSIYLCLCIGLSLYLHVCGGVHLCVSTSECASLCIHMFGLVCLCIIACFSVFVCVGWCRG